MKINFLRFVLNKIKIVNLNQIRWKQKKGNNTHLRFELHLRAFREVLKLNSIFSTKFFRKIILFIYLLHEFSFSFERDKNRLDLYFKL